MPPNLTNGKPTSVQVMGNKPLPGPNVDQDLGCQMTSQGHNASIVYFERIFVINSPASVDPILMIIRPD